MSVYKRDLWDFTRVASVLPGGSYLETHSEGSERNMPLGSSPKPRGRINHPFFFGLQTLRTRLY